MSLLSDYAKKVLRHPLPTLTSADAYLQHILSSKLQSAIEAFEKDVPMTFSPITAPAQVAAGLASSQEDDDEESSETIMSKHSHPLLAHIGSSHSVTTLPVCKL